MYNAEKGEKVHSHSPNHAAKDKNSNSARKNTNKQQVLTPLKKNFTFAGFHCIIFHLYFINIANIYVSSQEIWSERHLGECLLLCYYENFQKNTAHFDYRYDVNGRKRTKE